MESKVFDVAIIGGGIAGLSASICAASEGFSTVLMDNGSQFGGQAGTASLIENLIGFPDGITGKELTMKSIEQAKKFDVQFKAPFNAVKLDKEGELWKVISDDNEEIVSKTVLLTVGLANKRLDTGNIDRFLGVGVTYGSPKLGENYKGQTVSIVGGANSAGQAAVYLAECGCTVNLIIRGEDIRKSMSNYLCHKILERDNIKIFYNSEITGGTGKCSLEGLTLKCPEGELEIATEKLFILIGSKPKTGWLKGIVPLDEDGFIITDDDLRAVPGIFCAGDARATSIKRVSCALGEGGRTMRGIRQDINRLN